MVKNTAEECRPTNPPPRGELQKRINRLARHVEREKVDAFFIHTAVSRYYFTAFECSNAILLLCPGKKPEFYTDFRYLETAKAQLPFLKVRKIGDPQDIFAPRAKREKWSRVAYEGALSATEYHKLKKSLPKMEDWPDHSDALMRLRSVKSPFEQTIMRKAVRANDQAFQAALEQTRPGMTEWEIRGLIRDASNHFGQNPAFSEIVCIGANASRCHHKPTQKSLRRGQELLIDMGTIVDNYHSDMTRTVFFGKPSPKLKEIYKIVLDANLAAIDKVKAGVNCAEVDSAARDLISKAGYGKMFGHGLGHSLGLEIHENPRFSQQDSTILKSGMVLTVEPGIYIPGTGGVRIEDVVIVKRNGCEVVTGTPKELLSL